MGLLRPRDGWCIGDEGVAAAWQRRPDLLRMAAPLMERWGPRRCVPDS